jgi:hypothetical protein
MLDEVLSRAHERWKLGRRERIASAALQGMLAQGGQGGPVDYAEGAVALADALIDALDRSAGKYSPDELTAAKRLAAKRGVTVSELLRALVAEEAKRRRLTAS